jgi:hypothetical protein
MDPRTPAITDAVRSLLLDETLAEVARALDSEGIPIIVLKGPSIARWLYDDEGERPYLDIDVLVSPSDAASVERVLARAGFERRGLESLEGDRPHASFALRRADGVAVDLHTTFLGVGVPAATLWSELSKHTDRMTVAGATVTILDPPARALVLALHAAKDGGRVAKAREDLRRGALRLPEDVWRKTAELADRLDASPALAAGLRRAPEGSVVADRLSLTDRITPEIALRIGEAPALAVGIDWMLHGEGKKDPRLVLRKVFPPADYLRGWKPIARKGWAGLAVAYAWRPFWVAWKVVPALVAVFRARRGTGRSR